MTQRTEQRMTPTEERRWRRLTNTVAQLVNKSIELGYPVEDTVDSMTSAIIQLAYKRLGSAEAVAAMFSQWAERVIEPDFVEMLAQGDVTPHDLH